jgi:hypothetical protein
MLASLAAPIPIARRLASLDGNHETAHHRMPRRTIRKPTRWTADEWRQIEGLARARADGRGSRGAGARAASRPDRAGRGAAG